VDDATVALRLLVDRRDHLGRTRTETVSRLHHLLPELGDVGDISRFASRGHFASWNGTAPIDASSGDQQRHRLSRAGNRRINRVLHIMAVVQLRHDTEGRAYYRRTLAAGKTTMEAMRALKRRLSDLVYKTMVTDAEETGTLPSRQERMPPGTSPQTRPPRPTPYGSERPPNTSGAIAGLPALIAQACLVRPPAGRSAEPESQPSSVIRRRRVWNAGFGE
jgi:hypothetical protein